ncbi:MAG: hypothetical protein ACOC2E_02920 [Bacteroidota bacterium]
MKNKTLTSFKSNTDFSNFINSRFKDPVKTRSFPNEYLRRKPTAEFIKDTSNPEIQKIIERELIRDNIYEKYNFDITEFPFVVFYEKKSGEELKPFKKIDEAKQYCAKLLSKDIYSLLILIMNHDIECILYSND